MFKEIFESTSAQTYSSVALVIFLVVFAAVSFWALTRRKATVDRWSALPLEDAPLREGQGYGGCGGCCCGGSKASGPLAQEDATSGSMPGRVPIAPRGD